MAAYFQLSRGILECHVGSKDPEAVWQHVKSVQLDGDELTLALKILGKDSVPFRVFSFIETEARMIAINWR